MEIIESHKKSFGRAHKKSGTLKYFRTYPETCTTQTENNSKFYGCQTG